MGAKVLIALLFMSRAKVSSTAVAILSVLLAMTLIGASVDAVNGQFSGVSTLRYLAFSLSLMLTICFVAPETVRAYCRYLVAVPLLVAAFHVVLAQAGALPSNGSRVFYVGGGHPNLGGEISAAAALAAAVAFTARWALPVLAVFFYSAMLMQARAALIVIVLIGAVVVVRAMVEGLPKGWLALLLLQMPLIAVILLISNWDFMASALDAVLLIDDPSRGVASGATGRYEHWKMGWDLFSQSPVLGTGLSVFETGETESPHNAFLFGLSQHGLASLGFWAVVGRAFLRSATRDPYFAATALSFAVLLTLNDRFINLNQYPFCFFALILIMGASVLRAPVSAVQTRLVQA
ncbi:O-antigen ligase family protein [Devosia rhizoryzae]|uniref:O-antigen ligase family protein n=1 Tax=Devosia rhizoryzae TaxID=2774137 RepID=A0ABX7C9A2_9HYPH|nr:O-antigen ligase family protein [Devosia rhizoryzae]QQR40378.1 O-antigen ligase family protein [Devosia rhizoryzae]